MTVQSSNAPAEHSLYDEFYYRHCCGTVYVRNDFWLRFFGDIAERIRQDINPESVLDAGCAMGFLVEMLRARGVEAYGLDISAYAIEQVVDDIKPYCQVGSVLHPLPRRYGLIVTIEVLEHLTPQECDRAVANLCAASDDVLFSSTPDDYREATHINVRPPDYWAGLFARHGFYRDIDFDATFITAWAMRFRKAREPMHRLVEAYERRLWQQSKESAGARAFALESRNLLAERDNQIEQARTQLAERDQQALAQAADHAQARAELTAMQTDKERLSRELEAEKAANRRLTGQVNDILTSPGWRFVTWVGRVRLKVFPAGSRREQWWLNTAKRLTGGG
ncbi:MAG: methyltransferase domain-containing protein [Chloroflexi bacterium]|nr:methyltransferase domain-containing protein [Chloroflexota bacterium]MCL5273662.1 methyltransferase domain-containing protein [Chloroflexota bacterium]